jgi:hypothetical protein
MIEPVNRPGDSRKHSRRVEIVIGQPGEVLPPRFGQQGVHIAHLTQIHRMIDDPHARIVHAD